MKAYGDAIDGDNELTPRPSRHQRSASSRASSQSEDSNEDARTTSSTQSTSAIKTFADLQFALRPTIYETLDGSSAARLKGVLKKYKALKQLSSGIAIIPESVRVSSSFSLPAASFTDSHSLDSRAPSILTTTLPDSRTRHREASMHSMRHGYVTKFFASTHKPIIVIRRGRRNQRGMRKCMVRFYNWW